jgi:hypothetical protein
MVKRRTSERLYRERVGEEKSESLCTIALEPVFHINIL